MLPGVDQSTSTADLVEEGQSWDYLKPEPKCEFCRDCREFEEAADDLRCHELLPDRDEWERVIHVQGIEGGGEEPIYSRVVRVTH